MSIGRQRLPEGSLPEWNRSGRGCINFTPRQCFLTLSNKHASSTQTPTFQTHQAPKTLNPIPTNPTPSSTHTPIDHLYISQLNRVLLLKHHLFSKTLLLNPRSAISIFQNQEYPLHALKFYTWLSSVNPTLAIDQSVQCVLENTLYRKGPVLLSVELLRDVKNSGFQVTGDMLCVLMASLGRLGLANHCAHVFGQISFLSLNPSTRLCNALIDALVKSNSIDLAYLKFQQMAADNCRPDRITYNTSFMGFARLVWLMRLFD